MSDSTTEGYSATPAEIEGMLRNLCAYALSEPDPMQRYVELTQQQVLFEGLALAVSRERGKALADLLVAGVPIADMAEKTNLKTIQNVRKLVRVAGATERVKAATTRKAPTARKGTAARKAATPGDAATALPPYLDIPAGSRLLSDADRIALGLPSRRRRARGSAG